MSNAPSTSVFSLAELPDGGMKRALVGGRALLFLRYGDEVYAMRDVCPHQGARLSDGMVTCGRAKDEVGRYRAVQHGRIVRCPWHNWEFDVTTGSGCHDPEHVRVATYPVTVENGQVYLAT